MWQQSFDAVIICFDFITDLWSQKNYWPQIYHKLTTDQGRI